MAKERRSRLPLLLLIVAVIAVVVWWRQEQAKRAADDSFPEPGGYQPATAPAKTPTTPAEPVVKKTETATTGKTASRKTPAGKQPAKPRGAA